MTLSLSKGHIFFFLIFSFSPAVREVSHKINGLLSLSKDQFSSLKSEAFSVLKWESKGIVACRFKGDNLLCSNKNCCFLVIYRAPRRGTKVEKKFISSTLNKKRLLAAWVANIIIYYPSAITDIPICNPNSQSLLLSYAYSFKKANPLPKNRLIGDFYWLRGLESVRTCLKLCWSPQKDISLIFLSFKN